MRISQRFVAFSFTVVKKIRNIDCLENEFDIIKKGVPFVLMFA